MRFCVSLISIHVLRVEDDHAWPTAHSHRPPFQSTSSVWRTTPQRGGRSWVTQNFNPRPPCGGRHAATCLAFFAAGFQSTSSVWRTTSREVKHYATDFISIHVLRVEDDVLRAVQLAGQRISIHVLRVEDDAAGLRPGPGGLDFNPRPPCGGRQSADTAAQKDKKFQSTSSVWRTTVLRDLPGHLQCISIHVLRVEDDPAAQSGRALMGYFNPRPPCGGRPYSHSKRHRAASISIHVLRVEDDATAAPYKEVIAYFNPRPPCGGRPGSATAGYTAQVFQSTSSVWRTTPPRRHIIRRYTIFQSTSSVWRTTPEVRKETHVVDISIHVLRVEDDPPPTKEGGPHADFNPRPPCGGRPLTIASDTGPQAISIHVLRVEDDRTAGAGNHAHANFNPRPPCGGRHTRCKNQNQRQHFNPRPPCGGRLYARRNGVKIRYFNPRPPCGGRLQGGYSMQKYTQFQSTSSVWRTTVVYYFA